MPSKESKIKYKVLLRVGDDILPKYTRMARTQKESVMFAEIMISEALRDDPYAKIVATVKLVKDFVHGRPHKWELKGKKLIALRVFNSYEAGPKVTKDIDKGHCLFKGDESIGDE